MYVFTYSATYMLHARNIWHYITFTYLRYFYVYKSKPAEPWDVIRYNSITLAEDEYIFMNVLRLILDGLG